MFRRSPSFKPTLYNFLVTRSNGPPLKLAPLTNKCSSRYLAAGPTRLGEQASPVNVKVQEGIFDAATIDRFLNVIRSRSDPAYRSIMPIRTPGLWSESIIQVSYPGMGLEKGTSSITSSEHSSSAQPRHMHDSYCELVLPFSSSSELLEQYVNAWGGLRMGKLMEHLDSLAGSIAYKHMLGPSVGTLGQVHERGFYIVTASVDRLDMLASLHPVRDLRLSGHVIYTGRSSMDVAVKMAALEADGGEQTLMLGRFTMVCRDAASHGAWQVNPLIVTSPEEKALHRVGEVHKARRQVLTQQALSRVPPSSEEAAALHAVYLSHMKENQDLETKAAERVWMGETRLERCMLMFPQERNVHQKIFGGYLMRLAYELGFANATLFMRKQMRFLSLDGISFARPVPIGSILRLRSHIAHTTSTVESAAIVHVHVQANVVAVATGSEQTTNEFGFTWCSEDGQPMRRMVVPNTYSEAMSWIEGKRALEMGARIRGLQGTINTMPQSS